MSGHFEEILELKNEQSKRIAWIAFGVMTVLCVVLAIAIMMMTPLKRTEVRLLVVDKNTGYPSEITALADFPTGNTRQMQSSEALNKYFVQAYITAHDSYNHYAIREAYKTVQLWSTPQVFADYSQKFGGDNDIQARLGKNKVLEVVVHSINPLPQKTDFNGKEEGKIYQARIEKIIRSGDQIDSRATGTVTITFGYDKHLKMDEQSRNLNPLGFTVTAYQFVRDQRTEDFPDIDEFYPEPQSDSTVKSSPKATENAALQESVSPASADNSGQVENASETVAGNQNQSPKAPESAQQDSVPPVVAGNSGQVETAASENQNLSGSQNNAEQTQGESK